jgi:hypothetical protein
MFRSVSRSPFWISSFCLVAVLTMLPAGGSAAPWHPTFSTGTDFPLSMNARADVQTPFRAHLAGSIGWLPGPYADAINRVIVSMGGYDEDTGTLVRRALGESLVLNVEAGYPVFSKLRLGANWSMVTLGGSTTTPDVVATVAGVPLPITERGSTIEVASTLQMVGFELSWPFELGAAWGLDVGLGARFTVSASTSMKSDRSDGRDEPYLRDAERELDHIFETYAHTPVLSVRVGRGF